MGYIEDIREKIGHEPIILCSTGCLIFNEKGEVLLQHRADDDKWGNPGGCIELGEKVEEALKREIKEETNIELNEIQLFKIYSGEEQHHIYPNGDEAYFVNIVYKANVEKAIFEVNDEESKALKFFSIADIPENVTEPFKCVKEDLKLMEQ